MAIQQWQTAKSQDVSSFYVSFSDLMLLLCCFFVLVLSTSRVDIGTFEKMSTQFTGSTQGTLVELEQSLKKLTQNIKGVHINLENDGLRIHLDTNVLFTSGSAKLHSEAFSQLTAVLKNIKKTSYQIDVEGHTDNVPLYRATDDAPETNWSLSGKRASSVVHFLQRLGFTPQRLRVVGYADTKPIVSMKGMANQELEEARSLNRRVTLLVH